MGGVDEIQDAKYLFTEIEIPLRVALPKCGGTLLDLSISIFEGPTGKTTPLVHPESVSFKIFQRRFSFI